MRKREGKRRNCQNPQKIAYFLPVLAVKITFSEVKGKATAFVFHTYKCTKDTEKRFFSVWFLTGMQVSLIFYSEIH